MKLVVCLHACASGREMNQNDADALGHALSLGPPHTVTALLVGPAAQDGPLHRALSAGASRAVRLVGDNPGLSDFHTLGQLLAAAVTRLGADLVLTGAGSDEEGLGALSASVARNLGYLHVASVEGLAAPPDVDGRHDAVDIVVRGGGWRRRLRVQAPAVLSISDGPRRPAAAPSPAVGEAPAIEVLSLADPDATVVRRKTELLGRPELPSRPARVVTSAEQLVDALTGR